MNTHLIKKEIDIDKILSRRNGEDKVYLCDCAELLGWDTPIPVLRKIQDRLTDLSERLNAKNK